MSYDRRNREALGRVNAQLMGIINKCKREGNRGLTSAERQTFDRLEADHSRLEQEIAANEHSGGVNDVLARSGGIINGLSLPDIQDSLRLSPAAIRERNQDPYARAFSQYIRGGVESLDGDGRELMRANFVQNAVAQNTMSTTTGSQGGYVVPTGFSRQLEEAQKWFGGVAEGSLVGQFETATGNPWPWPTVNDTTNAGEIVGQNVQVTQQDVVFNQVTFNAYIGSSKLVLIPLALMQDSYFDLDALVARLLGIRLGRLLNLKCTVGAGTTEPTGIVTDAVAAGLIYQLPTGQVTTVTYNSLTEIEHKVDVAYRENSTSSWMFHDTTLKVLKQMVDGNNRPLWQPGLTASFGNGADVQIGANKPTILGHPYVVNNDMAQMGTSGSPTTGNYSILFGDMSCFKVRNVAGGVSVLRLVERYADYLQIGFIGWRRFDSRLIDAGTHPICVAQNATS